MKRIGRVILCLLISLIMLPSVISVTDADMQRGITTIYGFTLTSGAMIDPPVAGEQGASLSDQIWVASTDPAGLSSALKISTRWYDCASKKNYNMEMNPAPKFNFTPGKWNLYVGISITDRSSYRFDKDSNFSRFNGGDLMHISVGGQAFHVSGISEFGIEYQATYDIPEPIASVEMSIVPPAVGGKPDYSPVLSPDAHCYSADNTGGVWKNDIVWYDDTESRFMTPDTDVFYPNHAYSVTIWLTPNKGYTFSESVTGTFYGYIPLDSVNRPDLNQARFGYTFTALPDTPLVTGEAKSKTVALGKTAKFGVNTAGSNLNYQWQYSKDNGKNWMDWSGKTKSSFSVKASETNNGCLYRCCISNANGSVISRPARLTVSGVKPRILVQPASKTDAVGEQVTFRVMAAGEGLSYQWQYSKNNGDTWTNWSGKTNKSVTVKASATNNGCLYRCVIKNSKGSVTSANARLTVSGVKPLIVGQPKNQKIAAGNKATFQVVAGGTGMSYQWQYSTDGGKTWTNCKSAGYNTATFSFTASKQLNGRKYRCIVKNSYGSATSSAAVFQLK